MAFVRISIALAVLAAGCGARVAGAQQAHTAHATSTQVAPTTSAHTLRVNQGETSASAETKHVPISASNEIEAIVHARLSQADGAPEHDGKLLLTVFSEAGGVTPPGFLDVQPRVIIELPLSSVADAYGESRHCFVSKEGALTFVFTAGLDEKNFVPFTSAKDEREFRFSVNKYLCRALAAPFQCPAVFGGPLQERRLTPEMSGWKVGDLSTVELESKNAPATAEVSEVRFESSGKPFDYATCAKIAPSNGLCCVQHKTTEWHCGGKPSDSGWHQVSGDCYHRETGSTCTGDQPLQ